jgi:hypothetical protein
MMNPYIYESPDGGKTVYRRRHGQPDRELYIQDDMFKEQLEKELEWKMILQMAQSDPGLNAILEQAQIYYRLKK